MPARPSRPALAAALGAVLLVAGVALVVLARHDEAGVGWFAYAPLSDATFSPRRSVVVLTPARSWGFALAVLGTIVVSAATGYRAGRRRRTAAPPDAGASGDAR